MSSSANRLTNGEPNLLPAHGVLALVGYGIHVRVDRGHLLFEDGVGENRRRGRLARVGHGLKRLIVIGSDGQVSLSALQWLADQDAAFTMLDRNGKVLVTTGPVRPYDAKLRRAQSMSLHNGTAFRLSREIIDRKLAGQERVVLHELNNEPAAFAIRQYRSELAEVESVDEIRLVESQAAKVYWTAWRTLTISFPRKDIPRVPEHWRVFGSRVSPLTGSPRLATDPVNAILNYLYAILEAEARLAAAILGLDPGIGVLHTDTIRRDSLASDLMEPIRPDVDAFVLDWLKREPVLRNSFSEQRDGNCRLMDAFASRLSETAIKWARLVAPVTEWFALEIHKSARTGQSNPPARLTQRYKREVKGGGPLPKVKPSSTPEKLCRGCGKKIAKPHNNCKQCASQLDSDRLKEVARIGRGAVIHHRPKRRGLQLKKLIRKLFGIGIGRTSPIGSRRISTGNRFSRFSPQFRYP